MLGRLGQSRQRCAQTIPELPFDLWRHTQARRAGGADPKAGAYRRTRKLKGKKKTGISGFKVMIFYLFIYSFIHLFVCLFSILVLLSPEDFELRSRVGGTSKKLEDSVRIEYVRDYFLFISFWKTNWKPKGYNTTA